MSTQKEIARLARVSPSLVSRVLTGTAERIGIARNTIDRVEATAKALNYIPNAAARILKGKNTRIIGVIVRTFQDAFLGAILDELNREASEAGATLLVKGFREGRFDSAEMTSLLSYAPDALLLVGTMDLAGWDRTIFESGKPIVQIGARSDEPSVVSCGMDERTAARLIVDHLLSLGHERFGLIGDLSLPSQYRRERLLTELGNRGVGVAESWQFFGGSGHVEAGKLGAHDLLARRTPAGEWPTALVATGDWIAISCIHELQATAIRVPGDLSVCSYNDIDFASYFTPELTTVHQPVRKMASTALRMSLGSLPFQSRRLKPTLKLRQSTAPRA